jgi:hypothetical protein
VGTMTGIGSRRRPLARQRVPHLEPEGVHVAHGEAGSILADGGSVEDSRGCQGW